MDEHTAHEPLLLSSKKEAIVSVKNTLFLTSLAKWILKFAMWAIFVAWVAFIFLLPSASVYQLYRKCVSATSGTVFGTAGGMFMIFSAPILIIAFLSIAYVMLSGEEELHEKKTPRFPRFRLWTFPVIVDGPFGVVSAAELIGIVLFSVYIIWAIYGFTLQNLKLLPEFHLTSEEEGSFMLELTGLRFGAIGLYCLTFLFLPISRGSVLLRLIDIPFEHATRYHVWLGHLTMMLFTLHGLFYVIAWQMQGRLLREITAWSNVGIANLPGVISLTAGLLMWVTSLPPVRKENFELFFYTHQLYVVFVLFLALHVGDFLFSVAAGGIFLFMLDRFLRFCQSRATVEILSAKCLPCGTVEMVFSKPENLKYNALSFIFIQARELSWLQWHPFSVSSSPLEGKNHLSVLIKVLGGWTEKLRRSILDVSEETEAKLILQPHHKITASVEGPYGHESPYHLTYENLVLVAGGIGISPFIAILSDVLHRIKDRKPCLVRNILIVWAVKNSNELPLLHSFDIESICPFFSEMLNLEIQTYVTRESEPPLEEGEILKSANTFGYPVSSKCGISVLVGTGNIVWPGLYLIVSTVGLVLSFGLLNVWYINPFGISYLWYKGLLLLACMVGSVVIFGGLVVGLWHVWEIKTRAKKELEDDKKKNDFKPNNEPVTNNVLCEANLAYSKTIRYGVRPDFKEIFDSVSDRWGEVDVGVILCGPYTLQTSVAKECRSQSLKRRPSQPIFHFNSHSFDL